MSQFTFRDITRLKHTKDQLNHLNNLKKSSNYPLVYLENYSEYADSNSAFVAITTAIQLNNKTINNYGSDVYYLPLTKNIKYIPLWKLYTRNQKIGIPRAEKSRATIWTTTSNFEIFGIRDRGEYLFSLSTLFLPIASKSAEALPNNNNPIQILKPILPWAKKFQWNKESGAIQWMENYISSKELPPTKPNTEANVEIYL